MRGLASQCFMCGLWETTWVSAEASLARLAEEVLRFALAEVAMAFATVNTRTLHDEFEHGLHTIDGVDTGGQTQTLERILCDAGFDVVAVQEGQFSC